ncbi:hypothetical protein, partial [Chryseobacterium sp. CH21]|uniref:hypothetical protein n=1 Tax=Chryseobacterium sp. CH21 TaxID=713556 RepID=UPI001E2B4A98
MLRLLRSDNDVGWRIRIDDGRWFGFVFVLGWVQNKKNPLSSDKGFFKNKIKTGGGLLSRFRSTIG